jgi:hypothetical protein
MDSYEDRPQGPRDTYLAMVLLILVGIPLFVFFNILTSGLLLNTVLGALGLAILGSIHYFLWGRSLTHKVASERDRKDMVQASHTEEWPVDMPAESRQIGPL